MKQIRYKEPIQNITDQSWIKFDKSQKVKMELTSLRMHIRKILCNHSWNWS